MALLYTDETPQPGMLVGRLRDTRRFELLKRLNDPKEKRSAWQAQDSTNGQHVLVEIVPIDLTPDESVFEREGTFLWKLAGYKEPFPPTTPPRADLHPGQRHCIAIVDAFSLPHPLEGDDEDEAFDGAVVTELLGPSLREWQQRRPTPFFAIETVRQVAVQLLLVLDHLHASFASDNGRIAHLGVSLDSLRLATFVEQEQLEQDKPADLLQLKLGSFGSAIRDGRLGEDMHHWPANLQTAAPEQLLLYEGYGRYGPARAADIWAVGAVVSLLLFNKHLVLDDIDVSWLNDDQREKIRLYSTSAEVIISLASLNKDQCWPDFYTDSMLHNSDPGYPFNVPGVEPMPTLRERVEAEGKINNPAEVDKLVSFLGACWTLDPYTRPSAKELLQYEWLAGVEQSGMRRG
ncbi:hypothetical protein JCM10207_000182 [Rhodosporidiobolus poonsookiae]